MLLLRPLRRPFRANAVLTAGKASPSLPLGRGHRVRCALLLSASDYEGLPSPADAAQARLGFERWREAIAEPTDAPLAAFMRELAADAAGHRLLAALFGNSP